MVGTCSFRGDGENGVIFAENNCSENSSIRNLENLLLDLGVGSIGPEVRCEDEN